MSITDKIEQDFDRLDTALTELFISMDGKVPYTYFDFYELLSETERKLRLTSLPQYLERFKEYIYYLNELFVVPYVSCSITFKYDDSKQLRVETTRYSEKYCEVVETVVETPYSNIDSGVLASKQDDKPYCLDMNMVVAKLKDVKCIGDPMKQMKGIKQLFDKYFGIGVHNPYSTILQFKNHLLSLHKIQVSNNTQIGNIADTKQTQANKKKDIKWLLVDDIDEFVKRNKSLLVEKKGKEAYLYVLAMQKLGHIKEENYGEIADLFDFVRKTFGVVGTAKAFGDAIRMHKNGMKSHYPPEDLQRAKERIKY